MRRIRKTAVALLLATACNLLYAQSGPESGKGLLLEKSRIFHRVTDQPDMAHRYNYRIPSLVATASGTVLAFADRRHAPEGFVKRLSVRDWGHPTDICAVRSVDGGRTWSEIATLARRKKTDIHGGPALADRETGRVFKFMRYHPTWKYSKSKEYAGGVARDRMYDDGYGDYVVHSDDDGLTWSKPRLARLPYPDGASGCGVGNSNHGIQLSSGRLVIQAKYYMPRSGGARILHRVLFYSDDHGETWRHGGVMKAMPGVSAQEFLLAECGPNEIYLNFRTSAGYRATARSVDGGLAVGEASLDKNLIGANCHAGLVRLPGGPSPRLVFSSPSIQWTPEHKSHNPTRERLTVHLSEDAGKTWPHSRVLCEGLAAYSDLAVLPDGSIVCVYESGDNEHHDFMEFARFNVEWLTRR